jgi:hypothetical protein
VGFLEEEEEEEEEKVKRTKPETQYSLYFFINYIYITSNMY